jgi:hypothetical protein
MGTERKLFLWIERPQREAPHLQPVPKLRINGAILPLPHIPSGHAKRQIYCFYKIMLNKQQHRKIYVIRDGLQFYINIYLCVCVCV